jgi:ABC-type Na+ efflux pump permease subunit
LNLQRVLALTKKELKRTIREPAVLFMIFLFPIVFVFAFGASFGGFGGSGTTSYQVGVVNLDQVSNQQFPQMFIDSLSSTQIINIHVYNDNQTAQTDLSQGKVQAVILIPVNFGDSLTAYFTSPNNPSQWINTTIPLYLDKGSIVATQAVPPIIQQVLTSITNQNQQIIQSPLTLKTASLVEVKQTSTLDFIAPGMFTFASIFLIMMVA